VTTTFDGFAALLDYPTTPPAGLCAAVLHGLTGDGHDAAGRIAAFRDETASMTLASLQELYARTFDFDANTALYVGHQLFGEEGRRGMLIAGLIDRYQRLGLSIGVELADHFSPVLRSLTLDGDSEEAADLIRMALRPALAKVLTCVERRGSPYAAVLQALAHAIDARTGERFELRSDGCHSSSSPFFLTLLS
jgi:nitrate reductase assembly molybdenum cofactor insertion protein NarJ